MKIIFNIFDKTWRFIVDVFVEEGGESLKEGDIQVHSAITHYRVDFPGFLLDEVIIGAQYQYIEHSLESYKYHSERAYRDGFVNVFEKCLDTIDISPEDTVITTVPMHWSRYGIRGFDHMDYIAKVLSKNTGLPYIQYLESRFSYRQSHLSRKKRLENRKNHFRIKNPDEKLPKTIILIDDVISTGATANECARVYKDISPESRVIGVFLSSNN